MISINIPDYHRSIRQQWGDEGTLAPQEHYFPASEQLQQINRACNQAFYLKGFCHAFNNPINSIQLASLLCKGYLQDIRALFDEADGVTEQWLSGVREAELNILNEMPQTIDGINASGNTLKKLVSHLAEFTGRGTLTSGSSVDLNRLITHCCSMAHYQIAAYTSNVTLDLHADVPLLPGNGALLSQVVFSLLKNALLSLSGRSDSVTIATSYDHDGGQVRLSVQDSGSGIAPEHYPQIFSPFFSTWPEHGCAGLGLTVAEQIIRTHRGRLVVDSAPGKGTNIQIFLPVDGALCKELPECAHE